MSEIQPQLQVRPGDLRVVDQQPVPLIDADAMAADDEPVVDRRRLLLGAVRRHDEHGGYRLLGFPDAALVVSGVIAHRAAFYAPVDPIH